ncbi:hypothetical protein ACFQE1_04240 [Halobium palmae]|uniref:Small CPxCG-related zinc finger protein n=1 Tax=Halobium palmae TaxID=1776492 RepID=A0ABD5RWB5_9EURY
MTQTDLVQCSGCGWTGHHSDLEDATDATVCPACGQTVVIE